ncbi:MAG: hypothetical protein KA914_16245 [Ottowia sp.]|nr:hypothetical protein [Ottowia sp.]
MKLAMVAESSGPVLYIKMAYDAHSAGAGSYQFDIDMPSPNTAKAPA